LNHIEKLAELESLVESLQKQLQQEEEYSKDVVAQWQDACTTAEEDCAAAKSELEDVTKSLKELQASMEQSVDRSQYSILETQLAERDQELGSALESLKKNEVLSNELQGELNFFIYFSLHIRAQYFSKLISCLRDYLPIAWFYLETKHQNAFQMLRVNWEFSGRS
jgi:hypothetical protein